MGLNVAFLRVPNIKFNVAKVLESLIPIVDQSVSYMIPFLFAEAYWFYTTERINHSLSSMHDLSALHLTNMDLKEIPHSKYLKLLGVCVFKCGIFGNVVEQGGGEDDPSLFGWTQWGSGCWCKVFFQPSSTVQWSDYDV